jgi:4-oxalocrotonate tautomerase
MPLVHIHISQGKTDQQKHDLMLAITEAIEKSIGAERKAIRVFLHELPLNHIMVAGNLAGSSTPPARS